VKTDEQVPRRPQREIEDDAMAPRRAEGAANERYAQQRWLAIEREEGGRIHEG